MTKRKKWLFRIIVIILILVSGFVDHRLLADHWTLVSNSLLALSVVYIGKKFRDRYISATGLAGLLVCMVFMVSIWPKTYVANPTTTIDNWRLILNTGFLSSLSFVLVLIGILEFKLLVYTSSKVNNDFRSWRKAILPIIIIITCLVLTLLETSNYWYYKGQTSEIYLKFEAFEKYWLWFRTTWLYNVAALFLTMTLLVLNVYRNKVSRLVPIAILVSLIIIIAMYIWPGMALLDKMRYGFMNSERPFYLLWIRYICYAIIVVTGIVIHKTIRFYIPYSRYLAAFFILIGMCIGLSEVTNFLILLNYDSIGKFIYSSRYLPWSLFLVFYITIIVLFALKKDAKFIIAVMLIMWVVAFIKVIAIDLPASSIQMGGKILLLVLYSLSAFCIVLEIRNKKIMPQPEE